MKFKFYVSKAPGLLDIEADDFDAAMSEIRKDHPLEEVHGASVYYDNESDGVQIVTGYQSADWMLGLYKKHGTVKGH